MDKIYRTLLVKAFTPFKRHLGKNGGTHWPARVLDTLETKYRLLPKDMLRLGYLQRNISAGNLNTDYIYIYDRMRSQEQNTPISAYRDLSQNYRLLLFKGNVFPDGSVHLERPYSTLPHPDAAPLPPN